MYVPRFVVCAKGSHWFLVQQRPSYMSPMYGNSMPMGMYGMGMGMNGMQYGMNANIGPLSLGKGKGKEVDFEAAFAHYAEALGPTEQQTSRIEEVDDSVANITETLQGVTVEDTSSDFQK